MCMCVCVCVCVCVTNIAYLVGEIKTDYRPIE